jgi:3-phosphoshikimate 1-carboxyvinyltransferase
MASSKASIAESEVSGWSPAPPSKSYTLRGLMCAALSGGRSEVVGPLGSDDTEAAIDVLRQVGVTVDLAEDRWLVHGGRFREANAELHCRESAVTLRFMTAVSALLPGRHRLTAGPSLARRPVGPLVEALRQLGATCSAQDGLPPVTVDGGGLRGGTAELPGNVSSQFISALLLAAPRSQEGVTLKLTTPLESAPYVLMTLDCLQWFGVSVAFNDELDVFEVTKQPYRPATFHVEGDWSSASYLLALGALAGEVTVRDLSEESLQGDKAILDFLQDMGASVTVSGDSVTVRKSRLRPIRTDLSDCTDLLPTAAALAALADGESHLSGIGRTRLKESDRVSAVREGLERMGIGVVEEPDRLLITGGTPKGATINSKDDHRIAMAFSLLGAVAGDTVIEGAECVSKTYPEFWDVLADLGVRVTLDG